MKLEQRIETRNDVKALSVRLTGDYRTANYSEAWNEIMEYCKNNHIEDCGGAAEYITIYLDDPQTTPAEKCRLDVGIAAPVVNELQPSGNVEIHTIEGGKFIVFLFKGPYSELGKVYEEVYGNLLRGSKVKVLQKAMFEKYLSDPETTKPEDLLTELWIPIA